ncbi:Oidioi.mRNA.OKI2018_I69.PAR.g9103.t1.cds [Oikopleura dioica]|uniref:Oidioi.mRNA.OKI2018_I69.PAR.g9103.t1.cds n=1 Tax=Oikopleura dioica TaxID=34765 RepID=A0ABN7RNE5_OIKDI|nr:Oidioi.mRNA.OKI2018_I69.PAR.g9103.t1.cds [Oikopleura dioica]
MIRPSGNFFMTAIENDDFLVKFAERIRSENIEVIPIGLFDADEEEIEMLSPENEFNKNRMKDDIEVLLRPDKLYEEMCESIQRKDQLLRDKLELISSLIGKTKSE